METLQTQDENTVVDTHSFFESKEHYFKFLDSWKQYIADGHHKCGTWENSNGGTVKYNSSLTCTHHLIYNGLRKKDLHKSFSPLTSEGKLNSMWDKRPYGAFYNALSEIRYKGKSSGDLTNFLAPFGDTVTQSMLIELSDALWDVEL